MILDTKLNFQERLKNILNEVNKIIGILPKLQNILAVCFWATQRDNLLIPFFKPKNIFFTSTNAIFNIITYTHCFLHF